MPPAFEGRTITPVIGDLVSICMSNGHVHLTGVYMGLTVSEMHVILGQDGEMHYYPFLMPVDRIITTVDR